MGLPRLCVRSKRYVHTHHGRLRPRWICWCLLGHVSPRAEADLGVHLGAPAPGRRPVHEDWRVLWNLHRQYRERGYPGELGPRAMLNITCDDAYNPQYSCSANTCSLQRRSEARRSTSAHVKLLSLWSTIPFLLAPRPGTMLPCLATT